MVHGLVLNLTVSESNMRVLVKITRRAGVHVSLWLSASSDRKYCRLSLITLGKDEGSVMRVSQEREWERGDRYM